MISRSLLAEGGPEALSMREVARRAGCTHQAPYHYFEDRETIVATLVVEGFDELTHRLSVANDLASAQGLRAAMIASAEAYVGFALSQAGVFQIMFRPAMCDAARFPAVQAAGARAYAQLERLNQLVHGAKASAALATILWAHVHGLACLLLEGSLPQRFASEALRSQHLCEVGEQFVALMGLSAAASTTSRSDQPA